MHAKHPLERLAASLHHAALVALPDLAIERRDFLAMAKWTPEQRAEARAKEDKGERGYPMVTMHRRPTVNECALVNMFPQTWGSSSLGFGDWGDSEMTAAFTVVLQGPAGHRVVYWDGEVAYLVDPEKQSPEQRLAFKEDVAAFKTADVEAARDKYGAIPCPVTGVEAVTSQATAATAAA